jgi:O-antigen ligase
VLVVLIAAAALGALAAARLEGRWTPGASARRAWTIALAAAGAAVILAGLVRIGNPLEVVDAFTAPLPAASGDLGDRLASASGNGRADYWRAAWTEIRERPLGGGGAGSWERWWLLERPTAFAARDAHNLYLEALAELGPLGLLLLLAALAPPLLALPRGRAAAAAGAAYAAFLLHAVLDWDWEIPAVTATALLAGQAVLATTRVAAERPISTRARTLGLAALLPLAVAAGVAHAGNRAAAEVDDAIGRGDAAAAIAAGDRAERYAPWSTEALRLQAEARLAAGDRAGARPPLREALDRDPDDWELWYVLSFAFDAAAADEAWERARALNPRAPELAVPRSGGTPQDRS